MPTLAWFTPLPPVRSGIARYSLELLERLGETYQVDVFVDRLAAHTPAGAASVSSAHDFVWKQAKHPYDLTVYQLGNAPCHDYMWPYLTRFPGLVTLHDGQLHHARARRLLQQGRANDYQAEFVFNHPQADPRVVAMSVSGLLGSLTYLWPMRRVVIETSRLVLVHNAWLADELRAEVPEAAVTVVEMGVPDQPVPTETVVARRTRLGVTPETVLFAAFGKITPEKRISQALRALASVPAGIPWHFMLCGEAVDHYDVHAEATRLGIATRVSSTGFVDETDMPSCIAAADVAFCLRWPSSRETSASWLRCLAAGKPTLVTDSAPLTDLWSLDPRDWYVAGCRAGRDAAGRPVEAACVSIDILDEDHSLGLAVRRLATDGELRHRLGRAARALWSDRFTIEGMADGYRSAIDVARATPLQTLNSGLPHHLFTAGTERAALLTAELGLPVTRLQELGFEAS